MAVLIDYIWQSSFVLLCLYGVFLVFLRKERAFRLTRVYLLLAPAIAFICPILEIPVEFKKPGISLNQTEFFRALSQTEAPDFFVVTYGLPEITVQSTRLPLILEIKDYLVILYLSVAIILLARLLWGLVEIRMLSQRGWNQSTYDLTNNCLVVPTFGKAPVFSFFKKLFWDNSDHLSPDEERMVYGHELGHIRQMHSWDKIYIEVLGIIFWFNPIIHMIGQSLSDLHEFLADDEWIRSNGGTQAYLGLLAAKALNHRELPITSHFGGSSILSRIRMIKKTKKPNLKKILAAIPATLAIMGMVALRPPFDNRSQPNMLADTIAAIKEKLLDSKDSLTIGIRMNKLKEPKHFEYLGGLENQRMVAQIGMFEYVFDGIRTPEEYKKVQALIQDLKTKAIVASNGGLFRSNGPIDQGAYFPGPPGQWEELVLEKIVLPEIELKMGLAGIIEIELQVEKDGAISHPIIKRGIGGGLDEQFLDLVQSSKLPKWKPATYKGKTVKSFQTVKFGIFPEEG